MPAMRARVGGLFAAVLLGLAAPVRAEPPEAGTWKAGATSVTVEVERWDAPCGERPRSSRSAGGGTVQLRRDGTGIVIEAAGRELRTGTCWSQNPAIRRVATQAGGGAWTTQCQTPEGDARAERGRYTLKLADNGELFYEDVSKYEWLMGQAVCAATTTTTQALVRVGDLQTPAVSAAAAPGAQPQAQAQSEAPAPACSPGPAAKLTVRPPQTSIELGARVCFRASVTDAADCAVHNAQVRWSLEHPEGIAGRLEEACFVAGERAAEAEGTFRVVASVSSLSTAAVVQVKATDLSSLIAKRVEGVALEGVRALDDVPAEAPATPAVPVPAPKAAAKLGASAKAAAASAETDRLLAIASACAFVVVLVAWVLLVRSRWRREAASSREGPERTGASAGTAIRAGAGSAADNWICPTCRVGYPRDTESCPKDGSALVPWREFAESRRPAPLPAGKRCLVCGRRYDATAAFCTDDGSALVTSG